MKKIFLIFALIIATGFYCYSQIDTNNPMSFDGFYIAKTGSVPAASLDIYTYFRFYKDGTIYEQAVTANNPQDVSAWFGRYKKFSQRGNYKVNGTAITIQINNKESKDFALEGLQETIFKGTIKPGNQLCLLRDNETKENCFEFYKVSDTTKLKYAPYKPEIKLPGEWRVKQVLKSNGQVYFINEDSAIVAIAVFIASKLPVYKESQSDYETAYAYYEWDSKYMNEEQKMEVRKIIDNKEKAFVTWNAKDAFNDNYHLFARHKNLLYNIMIFDRGMPVEKQLKYLEMLYDLNKDH